MTVHLQLGRWAGDALTLAVSCGQNASVLVVSSTALLAAALNESVADETSVKADLMTTARRIGRRFPVTSRGASLERELVFLPCFHPALSTYGSRYDCAEDQQFLSLFLLGVIRRIPRICRPLDQ